MSDDEANEKLVAPADFDGPTSIRHCTDVFCLLILIAAWVVMTGIGIYALGEGDYRLVLYPLDYDGNICGTDFKKDMTAFPYLLYVNSFSGGVCVDECPDLTNRTEDGVSDVNTLITYDGVWQPSSGGSQLPLDYVKVADYSNASDVMSCTDAKCWDTELYTSPYSPGVRLGYGYAFYAGTTYGVLGRCYMTTAALDRIEEQMDFQIASTTEAASDLLGIGALEDAYAFWNRVFADLWTARAYVLGFGFGVSLAVSSLYIFMLRLPFLLNSVVWGSIFLTIAMFFGGGYYAWTKATEWDEADPQTVQDNTITATTGAAIALWVVGVLLVVLTCCMRKAIQVAVLCVKQAGRAVNNMLLILAVPFLQAAALIAFVSVWSVYAVYLASLGEIVTKEIELDPSSLTGQDLPEIEDGLIQPVHYRVFLFDVFVTRCAYYLLFCLFWTANFIVSVGDMIIAIAVAKWFFARNKLTVGSWTVISSMRETLTYHLGTCAYGSLLVAIVQFIRYIIAKLQKKAKEAKNKIAEYILCCCQCCFWCLERCLKFINKNAYIQTAIFSTSFCKSCRASFFLIFRNAARVGAVTYVSSAVLIIGKLFISAVTTGFAYIAITEKLSDELFSVGGPVTIIFLIAFWMSDFFMDVFDMAISTVLHCFIADEEMFDGNGGYADQHLKDYVNTHVNVICMGVMNELSCQGLLTAVTTPFHFPGAFSDASLDDMTKNKIEVTEPPKDRGGLKDRRKTWSFAFDGVFPPESSQKQVWEATEPLVQCAVDGYNVTVFAYGQTGSGKTYTMLGEANNEGIIARAVGKLFASKEEIEALSLEETEVKVSVELLEIYNEKVRDLLAPPGSDFLKVTSQDVSGNVVVETTCKEQVLKILQHAQSRRCVKETLSNAESSRSHLIFTIHFDVKAKDGTIRRGKLNICDLAGSERLSKSGAHEQGGALLKETQHINKSLSTLSNVIERLQAGDNNVPFRESKLTLLLKDSLSGNSKTLAIICCNPLPSHMSESISSLRFASKVNRVDLKSATNFSC